MQLFHYVIMASSGENYNGQLRYKGYQWEPECWLKYFQIHRTAMQGMLEVLNWPLMLFCTLINVDL